jgi:hypothetical protein
MWHSKRQDAFRLSSEIADNLLAKVAAPMPRLHLSRLTQAMN